MISLAQKYRPNNLDDVVEQDLTKAILKAQLEQDKVAGCYLFVGGAGQGKSTIGFILAKEINQTDNSYIIVDATNNGSADAMRELVEDAMTKPLNYKKKVYIIEECQGISSKVAWDTLLRIFEFTPSHVCFILTTTNPEKLPLPILSRVQRFNILPITNEGIKNRLIYICNQEHIEYDELAIEHIAKLVKGSMRNAIQIVDLVHANGKITSPAVTQAVTGGSYQLMFDILFAWLDKCGEVVIDTANKVQLSGGNMNQFVVELFRLTLDISIYRITKDISKTMLPNSAKEILDKLDEKDYTNITVLMKSLKTLQYRVKQSTTAKEELVAELLTIERND